MSNQNQLNDFLNEMENDNPFTSETQEITEPRPTPAQEVQTLSQATESVPQNILNVPKEDVPVQAKSAPESQPEQESQPEESTPEQSENSKAESESGKTPKEELDPFEAALRASEEKSKERLIGTLANKNPIFKYASASDEITDKDITFETLRQKYETDFPELEESKNISWTVTYGKSSESITNPTKQKVFEVKAKIEKSDKFLADLKKAKKDADKNPECIVKPFVKAQKKGDTLAMPSYKGFFMNCDDALKSGKLITLVPSKDGRIYEIRKNQIGIFQSPAKAIGEFADVTTKFVLNLPKIPMFLLHQVISFFREISRKDKLEVLVHLVYDTKTEKYNVIVPKQKVTKMSVDSENSEYPEHVIHVMDIHSHNIMPAKFSATDNADEKATRLYGVIGKLNQMMPDIALRASNGGKFIELNPEEIFDFESTYPDEWFDNLDHAMAESICEAEKKSGGSND